LKDSNGLQKAIDQLGELTVARYLPKGMKLHPCLVHGHFLAHYKDANPVCPLCIPSTESGNGNGTTSEEVELFINLKDAINQKCLHKCCKDCTTKCHMDCSNKCCKDCQVECRKGCCGKCCKTCELQQCINCCTKCCMSCSTKDCKE
jgi:hypothetical protein